MVTVRFDTTPLCFPAFLAAVICHVASTPLARADPPASACLAHAAQAQSTKARL